MRERFAGAHESRKSGIWNKDLSQRYPQGVAFRNIKRYSEMCNIKYLAMSILRHGRCVLFSAGKCKQAKTRACVLACLAGGAIKKTDRKLREGGRVPPVDYESFRKSVKPAHHCRCARRRSSSCAKTTFPFLMIPMNRSSVALIVSWLSFE